MMRTILIIIGGVVFAGGMLAVIAAGLWYDSMEYKRRKEEQKHED